MGRIEMAAAVVFTITAIVALVLAVPVLLEPKWAGPPPGHSNVRNIASVYNSAVAAGADFGDLDDVRTIAELLTRGVYGSGDFAGIKFSIELTPEEIDTAENSLVYDHERRQMTLKPSP